MGKKILALLMVLALAMTMSVAAFADDDDLIQPKSIKINTGDRTMDKGKSMTLRYTITPRDTNYADDVTWTSSDYDVVEVDDNGYIQAIEPGRATIEVRTANGKTAKIVITVPGKTSSEDEWGDEWSSSSSSSVPESSVSSSKPAATTTDTSRKKISRDTLVSEVRSAGGKTVKLKNYSSVSATSLQAAAKEGKSKLQFDTMNGNSVTGRILIDPALAKDLSGDIKLGVYATSAKTKTAQSNIDSSKAKVIYCEQADYGMSVTITAKVGTMNGSNLKVYTCDSNGKNIKELKVTGLKIDSKGYVKFKTSTGGYLIVSDGALK